MSPLRKSGRQDSPDSPDTPDRPDNSNKKSDHTWVSTSAGLDALVADMLKTDIVSVDTEFHRERSYRPQLALVQIAFEGRVALIDPTAVAVTPLRAVLEDGLTVVMHACAQDIEVLAQETGAIPATLFDTQVAAGFMGLSSPSLGTLTEKLLRVRLAKSDRLTDWFERPLGPRQRRYAADDVRYLIAIHDEIEARLTELGRWSWALDECEQWRKPPPPPLDPELAWLRIKGARQLKDKARAVAYRLAAWREQTASRRDLPVRFVLSDMALVAIAQRCPETLGDLTRLRGVDGGQMRGAAGERILAEVRRGLVTDPETVPRGAQSNGHNVDNSLKPAVPLVSAWVDETARAQGLDRALLATRSDLTAFLAGDPDSRLNHGWRAEMIGDGIKALLAGTAALAFEPGAGLVLEDRA